MKKKNLVVYFSASFKGARFYLNWCLMPDLYLRTNLTCVFLRYRSECNHFHFLICAMFITSASPAGAFSHQSAGG